MTEGSINNETNTRYSSLTIQATGSQEGERTTTRMEQRWNYFEKEAEKLGYISERMSINRTPEKKGKNSSTSAMAIEYVEDLNRSFKEISKEQEESLRHIPKRHKVNTIQNMEERPSQNTKNGKEKQIVKDKTTSQERGKTSEREEKIEEIKVARLAIIEATKKTSGGNTI